MSFYCPICFKSVSEKCNAIQCDICDLWVHQFKCSGLTRKQFKSLSDSVSDSWHCPNCTRSLFPDPDIFNSDIEDEEPPSPEDLQNNTNDVAPDSNMNDHLTLLLEDINKVVTGLTTNDEEEDELELQFHSNFCSYVSCNEFNTILSDSPTKASAFHLNIASMSKHFDKLGTLLALLKCKFSFIGISETRSILDGETVPKALEQKDDFPIQGFEKFFTPTESTVGGVSLYVSNSISSNAKERKDLDSLCYLDSKLESVFVEIERPKETNIRRA